MSPLWLFSSIYLASFWSNLHELNGGKNKARNSSLHNISASTLHVYKYHAKRLFLMSVCALTPTRVDFHVHTSGKVSTLSFTNFYLGEGKRIRIPSISCFRRILWSVRTPYQQESAVSVPPQLLVASTKYVEWTHLYTLAPADLDARFGFLTILNAFAPQETAAMKYISLQ
jgi:hypothetical protein